MPGMRGEGGGVMSYVCTKELSIGCDIVRVGDVIEHVGRDDFMGVACRTFSVGGHHYCLFADAFDRHFEEVES